MAGLGFKRPFPEGEKLAAGDDRCGKESTQVLPTSIPVALSIDERGR